MTDTPAQQSTDPADARKHWAAVAQCLRCTTCGSDQVHLRSFEGVDYAYWRCRRCKHIWETRR